MKVFIISMVVHQYSLYAIKPFQAICLNCKQKVRLVLILIIMKKGRVCVFKRDVLFAVILISGALLLGNLFVVTDAAVAATDTAGAYSERLLTVGTYGDDVKEVQRAMTHVFTILRVLTGL